MPLFDQPITQAQRDGWLTRVDPIGPHLVAPWPRHVTPRANCAFRLKYTHDHAFSPMRWFCHWDSGDSGAPTQLDGYIDLAPIAPGVLQGSSGESLQRYEITLRISNMEVLPITGNPGINVYIKVTHVPSGAFYWDSRDFDFGTPEEYKVPMNTQTNSFSGQDEGFSGPFGWTLNDLYAQGVGSCYLFPGQAPPEAPFAQGNGVDAYVQLDSPTPFFGWYHKAEFDVRFRALNQQVFYGLNSGNANAMYLDQQTIQFAGTPIPLSQQPALNQWIHFEIERGWHQPADPNYKVRFDGQLVGNVSGPNFAISIDRILGNVPIFGPTFWGDMDMKNLTIDNGNTTAPNLILDMPMDPNACDVGPLLLGGTTFNMPLPSCP